ncbi:MAG: hypothetical protein WDW38_002572 [Sanguina aurantia]
MPIRQLHWERQARVSFHLVQCVHQHMHLTAGKAGGSAGVAGAPAPVYAAGRGAGAPSSGIKQQQQQQSGAGQGGNAPQGGANQMNADIVSVFQMPEYSSIQNGISAQNVAQALQEQGKHYNASSIAAAVDFMCNEGHLYSTTDGFFRHTG